MRNDCEKIRILHVVKDDKFFDGVILTFESDNRLVNNSIVIKSQKSDNLELIKSKDKVEVVSLSEVKLLFKQGEYDVVYFHSLSEGYWKIINWVPKNKIIIWWSWGYDIYGSRIRYLKPLLNIPLYKPLTAEWVDANKKSFSLKDCIISYVKAIFLTYYRKKNIQRISYYVPVIPIEHHFLKQIPQFKAKEFGMNYKIKKEDFIGGSFESQSGKILIGNSATPTNNHLDIINKLEEIGATQRSFVLPLNYGNQTYKKAIVKTIEKKMKNSTIILEMLPRDDYFKILKECSFAIFGVIRQQAMGNITWCFNHGVKVFLFRDSIVYKYFKEKGYYVYAIEEMDMKSLQEPLSHKESLENIEKNIQRRYRSLQLYNDGINEIVERLNHS